MNLDTTELDAAVQKWHEAGLFWVSNGWIEVRGYDLDAVIREFVRRVK